MNKSKLKKEFLKKAKQIFAQNTFSGYSKWKNVDYSFIAPANKEYTFQWLWDTAFHAIILSYFDTSRAKNEIRSFLVGQWENGFLPHIIFWEQKKIFPHWAYIESGRIRPKTTSITQPPALAMAVEKIYQRDADLEFVKEVVPKIAKHHRWLLQNRDPDNDFLVSIISPNESGMDELPVFQYALGFLGKNTARLRYTYRHADFLNILYRFNSKKILQKDYFNVEELLFNSVFIENCRSLARLFTLTGQGGEATFFLEVAHKAESSLLEKCWDKNDMIFYSLFSKKEHFAKVKTVASLAPLFLEGLTGEKLKKLVEKHLLNKNEFWLPYPVPSVSKDEVYYFPREINYRISQTSLLWRGPTWISTNWFIVKGLQKHGYNDIADTIIERMTQMITKYGFREYYNPETGFGYRRENFGWSTLIIDLL